MQPRIKGIKLAVLGGDARGVYTALELAACGASVQAFGLPLPGTVNSIRLCSKPAEAVVGVNAIVIPLPGLDENGFLHTATGECPLLTEEDLRAAPPFSPLFVGFARRPLKHIAANTGLTLVELVNLDDFAILNSIPSAEGAIQLAMERLPITIHGSQTFVLGFGRTGATLARMLAAIGAHTTVVARNPAARARCLEMGFRTLSFENLPQCIGEADVIFNTVPALVLPQNLLRLVKPDALIIDLASAPGGVDFEAAHHLGIEAFLAPSLPGKVAPKTAGQIFARIVVRLLEENLALGSAQSQGVPTDAAKRR
ncbi:MAG TPA: dipicolinate synthase subunit DpsA [Peptococcaceae bacterium]|nr:dipicolinate synthase subunit DpsA [Peptococcaceae bacterium]